MKWFIGRFRYAFAGIRYGIARDRSIRLQFAAGILALLAGWILGIDRADWFWIVLSVFLVILCEIFNSCIEKTVDYISEKRDPRARVIKDMAAGAVFLASVFALFCACMIYIPSLLQVAGLAQ